MSLIQLYEGANHTPLPKDGHVCVLPQGEVVSPSGQISQLKVCQLLPAGPLVVFPMELSRGNQSVTIDLPESLHMGSSVITDKYPYIEVNIPTLVPKEQDNTNSPLGKKYDTATANQPKTPWKPRITFIAEVNDLISQGMMDNYDQESEHSATGRSTFHRGRYHITLEEGKASFVIGYPFSDKCSRDRSFRGKQPYQHFAHCSGS